MSHRGQRGRDKNSIENYLSPSLWKKRHKEEIEWVKKMSPEEKFEIISELHLLGLRLIEARDEERKLKLYQRKSKIDKERLKNFIKSQLGR